LGLGSPEEGGKFGYPFRERRKENPKGPVILEMGEGLLNLLAGHSFPLVAPVNEDRRGFYPPSISRIPVPIFPKAQLWGPSYPGYRASPAFPVPKTGPEPDHHPKGPGARKGGGSSPVVWPGGTHLGVPFPPGGSRPALAGRGLGAQVSPGGRAFRRSPGRTQGSPDFLRALSPQGCPCIS